MIERLDVIRLLEGAPQTSVRQTIDVERLEDEILTEQPSTISGGRSSDGGYDSNIDDDYERVSEQVSRVLLTSQTWFFKHYTLNEPTIIIRQFS
jgi:hypothetical protein